MSVNKEELFLNCLELVNEQINKYQGKLDELNSYNEENNLNPDFDEYGNKGEMLTEYEKNAEYLDRVRNWKETLANLDTSNKSEIVKPGSLVETDEDYYFISVPLGEVSLDSGSVVYAISTEAPIYEHLEGKKEGDTFRFKDKEVSIVSIH